MKLIVDTNRLIAALVRDSYSRRILLSERFDFHTVALSRRELAKYEDELQKKSHLSSKQFHDLVDFLFGQVSIFALGRTPAFRPPIRPKCFLTCPCGDTPGFSPGRMSFFG